MGYSTACPGVVPEKFYPHRLTREELEQNEEDDDVENKKGEEEENKKGGKGKGKKGKKKKARPTPEEDPLFQCCDSTGEVTSLLGRRVANVSGSFLHLIDRYS